MSAEVFALGLVALFCWGGSGYWSGVAGRTVGARVSTFLTQLTNLVVVFPVVLVMGNPLTQRALVWGLASSVFGLAGFLLVYAAGQSGPIGVVGKLRSGVMALVPIGVGVVQGSRPSILASGGIALVLVSLVMLAMPSRPSNKDGSNDGKAMAVAAGERRATRLALLAGLCFGIGVVMQGQTTVDDGMTPLVVYRVAIAVAAFAIVRRTAVPIRVNRSGWVALAVVGAGSAIGDVAYLSGLQRGGLVLLPAIVSVSPAVTVLLARWLANERIRTSQMIGIGVGVVGLILMKAH